MGRPGGWPVLRPHAPPLRVFPPCCAGRTAPVAGPSPFHGASGPKHALREDAGYRAARRSRGFTLIELLVAISVMALLAVLSWRSIDGMTRTQTLTQQRADQLLRLQAALGQWGADLDAITDTQEVVESDKCEVPNCLV